MKVETLLINTGSAFLASLYVIYYHSAVSGLRMSRSQKVSFSVVFALLNGFISSIMQVSVYKPLVLIALSTSIIAVLLKAPVIQAFLSFSIYTVASAIGNSLVPILIKLAYPGMTVEEVLSDPLLVIGANVFVNLLVFLLFLLIKPVIDYTKLLSRDKFLLVLTVATILVIT